MVSGPSCNSVVHLCFLLHILQFDHCFEQLHALVLNCDFCDDGVFILAALCFFEDRMKVRSRTDQM